MCTASFFAHIPATDTEVHIHRYEILLNVYHYRYSTYHISLGAYVPTIDITGIYVYIYVHICIFIYMYVHTDVVMSVTTEGWS